jgi:hypothetical protein
MFKISYKDLRSDGFRNAMTKLATCGEYKDFKLTYNLKIMAKEIEKALIQSQKEWLDIASGLIAKGEDGRFKIEKNDFVWKEGIDKDFAVKVVEDFGAKEVEIDRFKLDPETLMAAKLSPADLSHLEPLLTVPVLDDQVPPSKI